MIFYSVVGPILIPFSELELSGQLIGEWPGS
jgi:hypothetical protein